MLTTGKHNEENGGDLALAERLKRNMSEQVPDIKSWLNFSPLLRGEELLSANSPKMLITIGEKDNFGFFKPTKAFAEIAAAKGANILWTPVEGGRHCYGDEQAIAEFLIH